MDRRHIQKVAGFLAVLALAACSSGDEGQVAGYGLPPPGRLYAGFAKADITPPVVEGYDDANHNGFYDTGEKWKDTNGDGVWQASWIAGFDTARAAQGVHDPIWARTVVLVRDGRVFSFTVMDTVGVLPGRMQAIRARVKAAIGRKFDLQDQDLVLAATHTHEAPDTMGLWGEAPFKTGIDESWMTYLEAQAAQSIIEAFAALEPVSVKFGYAVAATDVNRDSRYPRVIDNDIYAAQFLRDDGRTAGSLIEYSMHPEVLWSENVLITSDYPHYVRERIEQKLGGTAVFASGMVGGLMTPLSRVHTFAQAETTGTRLADWALAALEKAEPVADCDLQIASGAVKLPVDNRLFRIMIEQQILDARVEELDHEGEGCVNAGCIDMTSVAVRLCGVAELATVPGELFPELGMGGFAQPLEWPDAADYADAPAGTPVKSSLKFPDAPTEKPLRRDIMTADYRFVLGLANGELGYIVPKSQWDPTDYEETVSLGPETAPRLVSNLEAVFATLGK
jgi:hypothetical protein